MIEMLILINGLRHIDNVFCSRICKNVIYYRYGNGRCLGLIGCDGLYDIEK